MLKPSELKPTRLNVGGHFGGHFGYFGSLWGSFWSFWGRVGPQNGAQIDMGASLGSRGSPRLPPMGLWWHFGLHFGARFRSTNEPQKTCKSKVRVGLRFGSILVDVGMHFGIDFVTFGTLDVEK